MDNNKWLFSINQKNAKHHRDHTDKGWFNIYGLASYVIDNENGNKARERADKITPKLKRFLPKPIEHLELREYLNKCNFSFSANGVSEVIRVDRELSIEDRCVYIAPILILIKERKLDEALDALENLRADIPLHVSVWGSIIAFLILCLSENYEDAKLELEEMIGKAQAYETPVLLNLVLPMLTKEYLPEEYWPWHYRNVEIDWDGTKYYCLPVTMHNWNAFGGDKLKSIPWVKAERPEYMSMVTSSGKEYQNGVTAFANAAIFWTRCRKCACRDRLWIN